MSVSSLGRLLARLGPEIDDPDEETFLLFAIERPSAQNLGFVDSHATALDLTVAGRDLTIHQSPAVLTSNRSGGTTGAVLWKTTPAVAEWLARPDNVFFCSADLNHTPALLGPHSAILELGCGSAGLIGLSLTGKGTRSSNTSSSKDTKKRHSRLHAKRPAIHSTSSPSPSRSASSPSPSRSASSAFSGFPSTSTANSATFTTANTVGRYVLTDQPYIAKLLLRNLEENGVGAEEEGSSSVAATTTSIGKKRSVHNGNTNSTLYFRPLDWETDEVTSALLRTDDTDRSITSFDAVLACDCIYNEALVMPLVQTFVDACDLRRKDIVNSELSSSTVLSSPTLCIVAQQLRDPDVVVAWLTAFHAEFQIWRVPEELLAPALRPAAGFVVHVAILRGSLKDVH